LGALLANCGRRRPEEQHRGSGGVAEEGRVMKLLRSMVVEALLVAVLSSVASAGISCEQETSMPASERVPASVSRGVWHISGSKVRMETTKAPTDKGPLGIVINRWDLGKVYFINPEKLVAIEASIPLDEIKEMQEKAKLRVEVTKTAETRKIGEYMCTRYDLTVKEKTAHYWVTSVGDLGPELDTFWERMTPAGAKVAEEAKKDMANPFLILYESDPRPNGTMTFTFSKIKKLEIPDSMFEVPAGYSTIAMPRTSSELRKQMQELEPGLPLPKKGMEGQP
jgi:hypothetical protein